MTNEAKIHASTYRRAESTLFRVSVAAMIIFAMAMFTTSMGYAYMLDGLTVVAAYISGGALAGAAGAFVAALYCNAMSYRVYATVPAETRNARMMMLLRERRKRH